MMRTLLMTCVVRLTFILSSRVNITGAELRRTAAPVWCVLDVQSLRSTRASISHSRSVDIHWTLAVASAEIRHRYIDPRVKEGRKSVYGITRKLQKTVFALVSQTDEKKLYVKISLKNIENDSDNFESVTNEFEYCYIIKCWKLLLSSVFADAPNYHKRKS